MNRFMLLVLLIVFLPSAAAMSVPELVESYDYGFYDGTINVTSFSDLLLDSNTDGLNDTLVINLTTDATQLTSYIFIITLLDDDSVIRNYTTKNISSSDPHATVQFPSSLLSETKYNYTVEIRTSDFGLAYRKYKTETDLLQNLEFGADVYNISDTNNANTTLRLTLTLNVTENVTTNVTAYLTYNNNTIESTVQTTLTEPDETITIDFDNETIKSTHYVGTYAVESIRIEDQIINVNYNTSSYDYEDFAKTSYVQDITTNTYDFDANNLIDVLQVNATNIIKDADNYTLTVSIYDENQALVAKKNVTETLSTGTHNLLINVSGSAIYKKQPSGNFTISVTRLQKENITTDLLYDRHITQDYAYTDFEPPARPDLALNISKEFNGSVNNITVEVSNEGTAPAYNVVIDIFNNETYTNQSVLTQLVVNQTSTFTYIVPNTTNNTIFVAIIDFDNFVDEENETNNIVQVPAAESNESGGGNETQPSILISLVSPTTNMEVIQNESFQFTTQVCCEDANCGNISVSLDPERSEYTYNSEKHCVGDACTTTFYSAPRFGFEDRQWKPIEELRSFKGTIPIICHVAEDSVHEANCVDYNYTHRKLRIQLADESRIGQNIQVRSLTPLATEKGLEWNERTTQRTTVKFTEAEQVIEEWFPIAYEDELHIGETSTNVSYLPNASLVNASWESTGGTLAMYGWADCDENLYWGVDWDHISVNTTANSKYGSGGGNNTQYSYCHRLQWNVTEEPNNITGIWAYARWTGSTHSGADSITKALYLGDVASHTWTPLDIQTNAWGEAQHAGEVTTNTNNYVNDTANGNYVYTLLHYNVTKSTGSSGAYSNLYYTELRITTGSGGGEPNASKSGLISTTPGATPFYTNGTNPAIILLNQDQCQNVTWYVNATGTLNSTHTFFAYANVSSNMSINDQTNTVNLTIVNETSGGSGWTITDTDTFASSAESWTGGTRDSTAETYNSSGDWGTIRKNYTLSQSEDVINITFDFWYADDSNDPKIFVPGDTASDNDYLLFDGTKPNIDWKHVDDGAGYGTCNEDISGSISWTDGDSVTIWANYSSGQWCTYHNGNKCRCETSTLVHADNFEINVGNAHVVAVDDVTYSEFQS